MRLLVASNLYPSEDYKSLGVFVKNFINELEEIGIEYDTVLINLKRGKLNKLISYFVYFFKFIFKGIFGRYDILYIHYVSHSAIPALIVKFFRRDIKVYANAHGSDVIPQTKTQNKMQKYVKKLLNKSDKIIVPSNYFMELVSEKYGLSKEKFRMYPSGGINKDVFYPRQINPDTYLKYGLKQNRKYIGNVSRIAKGKGWDIFIKAFHKLANNQEMKDYDAIVVGRGEQKQDFLNMIKELDLSDRIVYIEQVSQEELNIIYNIVDLFVFSTKANESLGLVGLEAMATKTNIIVSDYAAPKYIVENGKNGLKFEVGNSEKLYETIIKYFSLDEIEKEKLSENAYETASEYFRENIREYLKKIVLD